MVNVGDDTFTRVSHEGCDIAKLSRLRRVLPNPARPVEALRASECETRGLEDEPALNMDIQSAGLCKTGH